MNANKTKYKIKSFKFDNKPKNNAPIYTRNLRVSDTDNPKRYVLFSACRMGGYKNSYDFKFHSELSHFKNNLDFDDFIKGIGEWDHGWTRLINQSQTSNVHVKLDVDLEFDFFRRCLSYAHCNDPKVMVNPETGEQTLYLTRNFYIYKKDQSVRIERRFKRAKDIYNHLKVKTYEDLIYSSALLKSPFKKLYFFNPDKVTKKFIGRCKEIYIEFLELIDSDRTDFFSTKKGLVFIKKNTFVNAKAIVNLKYKGNLSKEIQPYMEKIKFSLCPYVDNQKEIFFKKENLMSDEQKKLRSMLKKREESASSVIEVLPPEPNLINEKSFREFSSGYDDNIFKPQELTLIYLRGYLNMSYVDAAKTLKVSKSSVRQMGKDLEKEIANVRLERGIEIRQNLGATKQHIETAKSLLVGKAIKALEDKLSNDSQSLNDLPIDKLIKIISEFSEGLEVNNSIYTGRNKPLIGQVFDAEKLIEEY